MNRYELWPRWKRMMVEKSLGFEPHPAQRRLQRKAADRPFWPTDRPPTVAEIFDRENLIDVFYDQKRKGGPAPGPDGVRYEDISHREVCEIMRDLSQEILEGRYRPSRARPVQISKGPGRGYRTLSLRSVVCRVVSATLNESLSPFWEAIFLPCSYGFRPKLGVWHLFMTLEDAIVNDGLTVVAEYDVFHAFDEVRIDDVMTAHRRYIDDEQLLALIESILRGMDGDAHTKGIDQGDPYSPTALNVLLHVFLDTWYRKEATIPLMFRYADNLVVAGTSVSEARQDADQTQSLLSNIGMRLKDGDNHPVDLCQPNSRIKVLGLTLRLEGNCIRYGLDEECWNGLTRGLKEAHEATDPSRGAKSVIRGWIQSAAPVLESLQMEPFGERILDLAAEAGFREIPRETVQRQIQSSRDKWQAFHKSHSHPLGAGKGASPTTTVPSGDRRPDPVGLVADEISEAGPADSESVGAGCLFEVS